MTWLDTLLRKQEQDVRFHQKRSFKRHRYRQNDRQLWARNGCSHDTSTTGIRQTRRLIGCFFLSATGPRKDRRSAHTLELHQQVQENRGLAPVFPQKCDVMFTAVSPGHPYPELQMSDRSCTGRETVRQPRPPRKYPGALQDLAGIPWRSSPSMPPNRRRVLPA